MYVIKLNLSNFSIKKFQSLYLTLIIFYLFFFNTLLIIEKKMEKVFRKLPLIRDNSCKLFYNFPKMRRKEVLNYRNFNSNSICYDNEMIIPKLKEHYPLLYKSQSDFFNKNSTINSNKKVSGLNSYEKNNNKKKNSLKKNEISQFDIINKDIDNKLKISFVNSFFEDKESKKKNIIPNIKIKNRKLNIKEKNNSSQKIQFEKKIEEEYDNNVIFTKMIIEDYLLKKRKKNDTSINQDYRKIFLILDGTIVLSESDIKGFYVEIPKKEILLKIPKKSRNKLIESFFKKCYEFFSRNCSYIFTPEHKLILDLIDIKKNEKYLIVSKTIFCSGIILIPTEKLRFLYKKEFPEYYKEYLNRKKKQNEQIKFKYHEPKIKIKKIYYGMKEKLKIGKLNNSFSNGENEIEQIEFITYSDNEEKKTQFIKKIEENCILKNDFFLYLNDKSTEKEISDLRKQLKYTSPVDIEKEYKTFKCDFNKVFERFKIIYINNQK